MLLLAAEAAPVAVHWPVILLSALGGALLTALFALLGAWINSRRQHAAWVREKRFEYFSRILGHLMDISVQDTERVAAVERLRALDPTDEGATQAIDREEAILAQTKARFDKVRDRISQDSAPVLILGPQAVREAVSHVLGMKGTEQGIHKAMKSIEVAMRSALDVKD